MLVAEAGDLDPILLGALALVESSFRTDAFAKEVEQSAARDEREWRLQKKS